MKDLLSAQNISVYYQKKAVLDNISFSIEPKDFITIVGPNGAGKSTLLKVLMGIQTPSKGEIIRSPNLKIGYVPQRLFPDHTMPITAKRFLTLNRQINSAKFETVIEETEISSLLQKPLFALSGGELQRVMLARALLNNPDLLVLDEPAQNLDLSGELRFYKLLNKIYKTHKIAILMVSHDLHMVMSTTKSVICLYHHICCSGTPQKVTKDPAFNALFGNEMAQMMAFYPHMHNHEHGDHIENGHTHSEDYQHNAR